MNTLLIDVYNYSNGMTCLKERFRQALLKAQEFNINDVYIACRENNIGSIKVIENNGGRFINTVVDEEGMLNNVYHIVIKLTK